MIARARADTRNYHAIPVQVCSVASLSLNQSSPCDRNCPPTSCKVALACVVVVLQRRASPGEAGRLEHVSDAAARQVTSVVLDREQPHLWRSMVVVAQR